MGALIIDFPPFMWFWEFITDWAYLHVLYFGWVYLWLGISSWPEIGYYTNYTFLFNYQKCGMVHNIKKKTFTTSAAKWNSWSISLCLVLFQSLEKNNNFRSHMDYQVREIEFLFVENSCLIGAPEVMFSPRVFSSCTWRSFCYCQVIVPWLSEFSERNLWDELSVKTRVMPSTT